MTTDNRQHAAAPVQALFGRKLGMTQVWGTDDRLVPPTVVQVGANVVTQVRAEEVDGYSAVQLRFDEIPTRRITKPMVSHFARAGVEPRHHLAEVRTSTADNYESGRELQTTVFEAGQVVDASGNTKSKGFAGIMKRHGFTGVSASHGTHRNHRKPDLIGVCATPRRVFKGLHVAGRMGNVRRIVQNLETQAVNTEEGLLLISSAIPGLKNNMILVRSSVEGA